MSSPTREAGCRLTACPRASAEPRAGERFCGHIHGEPVLAHRHRCQAAPGARDRRAERDLRRVRPGRGDGEAHVAPVADGRERAHLPDSVTMPVNTSTILQLRSVSASMRRCCPQHRALAARPDLRVRLQRLGRPWNSESQSTPAARARALEARHGGERSAPRDRASASAPSTAGAWNQASRSTRLARSRLPASPAPPSTARASARRRRAPARRRRDRGPPCPAGTSMRRTPRSARTSRRSAAASEAMQRPDRRLARGPRKRRGTRQAQCVSTTTRTSGTGLKPGRRQVSAGSSASHGADADDTCVVAAAHRVGEAPRLGAGDPLALARSGREAAVERGRELERHRRPPLADAGEEPGLRLRRLAGEQA